MQRKLGKHPVEQADRITRRQAAARLGISVTSVRRMEGTTLHPVLDDDGTWCFDSAELDSIPPQSGRRATVVRTRPRANAGQIAAAIFRQFERKRSLRQIVVSTSQPPELVRKLYREWLIGLADGERARQARELQERQRREMLEDERLHLEHMKSIST